MTTAFIRCPHCQSENIEPKGNMWVCHDCGQLFDLAAGAIVEEDAAEPERRQR